MIKRYGPKKHRTASFPKLKRSLSCREAWTDQWNYSAVNLKFFDANPIRLAKLGRLQTWLLRLARDYPRAG